MEVLVPNIGEFTDVPVADILIKPGDEILVGQVLLVLESDKSTMDVPSPAAGTVTEVVVQLNQRISEGTLICILTEAHRSQSTSPDGSDSREVLPASEPNSPATSRSVVPAQGEPGQSSRVGPFNASPSVRKLARELGTDLSSVLGSGPGGRILKSDVGAHISRSTPERHPGSREAEEGDSNEKYAQFGPVENVRLTRLQLVSGSRLQHSWSTIPHVTSQEEADVTDLEGFRKQLNGETADGPRLTLLAFAIKAVVISLREFPKFNSSLVGKSLCLKRYYHIGFAADTPRGLVVPVIRDADRFNVRTIAAELVRLSARAREGTLAPEEMQGGTFTVSSLGGIGGTSFTPIINPPQVAILGISRVALRPVWNGVAFQPREVMPLSLSWDHRVIDGAEAAQFNVRMARLLAEPIRMITD